jgi:hypothetical protein
MWIKSPPPGFMATSKDVSSNDKLNFLFKKNNVYIMDNHLAAGWVWATHLNISKSYNLFHIDQHFDLLDYPDSMQAEIKDKNISLHEISIEEYLSLKQPSQLPNDNFKLFRWDNYISNINDIYPSLFNLRYFATHDNDYELEGFITQKIESDELINSINKFIGSNNDKQYILNLDIDYFFHSNGTIKQKYDDHYISNLITEIKSNWQNIAVFTICLSPECCGGWKPAIEKTKLICEILKIEFNLITN